MTIIPESHQDLLNATVAVLATNGRDGFPQVTATWFLIEDDGAIKISFKAARQKARNLGAHPECTLFILDPANPYRTLEIRARAEIHPDPDYAFADRISRKYGADLRAMDGPGQSRLVVTLHPVKANVYGTGAWVGSLALDGTRRPESTL